MVLRIGYEPRIVGDAVGTTPIFNWLLYGYGIPALSFWAGSIFLRRGGDDAPLRMVESAAILFTVLLVFMEIRHYRQRRRCLPQLRRPDRSRAAGLRGAGDGDRTGTVAHPHRQHRPRYRRDPAHAVCRRSHRVRPVVAGESRCFRPIDVGGVFFNLLLLGYALPAVLALLLSYAVAGRRPASYANTIAAGALVLALTYVTLEIRRLFTGRC